MAVEAFGQDLEGARSVGAALSDVCNIQRGSGFAHLPDGNGARSN
jgi:hypothetical protein